MTSIVPELCVSDGFIRKASEIVGNKRTIRVVQTFLNRPGGGKLYLAGPSGSGKSTIIDSSIRSKVCRQSQNGDACGECDGCKRFVPRRSEYGLTGSIQTGEGPLNYIHINCRNATQESIHVFLDQLRFDIHGTFIIHLEEADHLSRYKCDLSLTAILDSEEMRHAKWIATSVTDGKLDKQFRRRWDLKLKTQRPKTVEVTEAVAKQCVQMGVSADAELILEIERKSFGVMSDAFGPLPEAALTGGILTDDIVVSYPFQASNPWQNKFFCVD